MSCSLIYSRRCNYPRLNRAWGELRRASPTFRGIIEAAWTSGDEQLLLVLADVAEEEGQHELAEMLRSGGVVLHKNGTVRPEWRRSR